MQRVLSLFAALCLTLTAYAPPLPVISPGDAQLNAYLRNETMALSDRCLSGLTTRDDWEARRPEYRRQLQEMLGLWPMPERTDLKPVVTGQLDHNDFTVEKISFQASPGLYCTADLYIPKNLTNPAPTILYECGHLGVTTNGVSLGNKVAYQADGEYFARNGYVCLVMDTLLMGEVRGIHTGTRNFGMWWWNSRGYTPAGVEAWFGLRALDYLCTRPEVDTNRFGVTGHSGGGAYSWTITALDDRIKAAAPLAGMADIQSHMFDGVIDSHCDCNFFVNIYRWDFPQIAALAAPRPLLIGGTDSDGLFRPPSTFRIYQKVQKVYDLYRVGEQLGLVLAPGPHDPVPELQLAVLRWFNKYLKGETPLVESAAKKLLPRDDLKVFTTLPTDSINTNIQDTFVPVGQPMHRSPEELRVALKEKVFTGWPEEQTELKPKLAFYVEHQGVRLGAWDLLSEHDVPLRLYTLSVNSQKPATNMCLRVLDSAGWQGWLAAARTTFAAELTNELATPNPPAADTNAFALLKTELQKPVTLAFFAPRGLGVNAWSGDSRRLTQIRRRYMLIGQTVDAMRVWDIRRAVQTLRLTMKDGAPSIRIQSSGPEGVNALYAALFESNVRELQLTGLPASQAQGPDYLNVLRVTDLPEVITAVGTHARLETTAP